METELEVYCCCDSSSCRNKYIWIVVGGRDYSGIHNLNVLLRGQNDFISSGVLLMSSYEESRMGWN